MPTTAAETLTDDRLLGGRVVLRQPTEGYRAAIDPVVLAAATAAAPGETVLDVCAGTGAAALCLVSRVGACQVVGLELDPALVGIARENARLNGVAAHVRFLVGDFNDPPATLMASAFDRVLVNPPYLALGRATPSPLPARWRAHAETGGTLAQCVAFCIRMLGRGGILTLIQRADRLDEILRLLGPEMGDIVVFPLWPKAATEGAPERPAKRVIVRARRDGRAPLRLLPGLVLHRPDGVYTDAAEAVLRHARAIVLD